MSLLKKASIITTPTAYAEDYLYSIKPAYALGSELVTNGNFATDSDWTKGSGWTISGGKANRSGESGNSFISQDINVISGRNYIVKYDRTYVSGDGQTNLFSYFEGNSSRTTRGNYEDTTQETVTVTDYFKPTYTGNLSLRVYGISDFTGSVDNVSIKEITDADFDFDRNSTGTRVNEDYLIEDVPYNLLSYTEELTNAYWDGVNVTVTGGFKDPFYGNNAFKVVDTSGGGTAYLHEPNIAEENYGRSIYARTVSGTGTVSLLSYFGNTNNDFTLTEKWQRFYVNSSTTSTGAANFYAVDFRDGDLTEVLLYAPQLTKSPTLKDYLKTTDRLDIPRIDYTNGEPSILLEPSRTNSVTYSNDFSNSDWIKQSGISSTYNTTETLSPEGLNNASKFTGNGTNGVYRQVIVTGVVARSIYLKSVTGNVSVTIKDPVLTVTTKTLNLNETWQRFELIESNGHGSLSGIWINDIPASGIYMYGAQVEAGSYATSLIHTSGSAVTRSADAANNAGNSDLFNDNEGVLYLESSALVNDDVNRFIQIHDGTYNNAITLYYSTTENQIIARTWASGSSIVSLNKTLEDATEFHKFAFSYKSGAYKFYIDGRQVATDTNSNTPTGLNQLGFLQGPSGNNFYANTKSVMVFKEALTDLELEKLTGYNNHELYMNYYNRLSYLGLAEEYNVESDINNYIL